MREHTKMSWVRNTENRDMGLQIRILLSGSASGFAILNNSWIRMRIRMRIRIH